MNSKKSSLENAANSPKILLQVPQSFSLPLSFPMMTHTQFLISRHKFQKPTSICNFPENTKKSQNKKYKNSRRKWKDSIPWCNKTNPSIKAEWLQSVSIPLQTNNSKKKSNFLRFRSNLTRHNWPKFSKESVTMRNSRLSSKRNMINCSRKKPNSKSRSKVRRKTRSKRKSNLKSSRFNSTMPEQKRTSTRIWGKILMQNTRTSTIGCMRFSLLSRNKERPWKNFKKSKPFKTRNWPKSSKSMHQCMSLPEKKKRNLRLWDKKWPVKLTNNKTSKRPLKPSSKTSPLSNLNAKKSKNSKSQSIWVSCNYKQKLMRKRKTLPKTRASLKSWKETEICTKRNSKGHKPTTRKSTKKSLTRKKFSRRRKMNCLDKKNKSKNWTNKSQT